jgi:hypothetical protein
MAESMRVIFCLPGRTFTSNYFNSWNATIAELHGKNISYAYSMGYDPVVYYARNRILGGQNTAGRQQKPWQGQLQYDRIVWIDSDMVWEPEHVLRLISHDKPVVSGVYLMGDGNNHPVVENLDYDHLADTGVFRFITKEEMAVRTVPFKASYTGFGFLSVKAGVIESMEYPWFQPRWVSNGSFHDFCAEDVGFCWAAQELGHEIWIDPSIRVGHEKMVVL